MEVENKISWKHKCNKQFAPSSPIRVWALAAKAASVAEMGGGSSRDGRCFGSLSHIAKLGARDVGELGMQAKSLPPKIQHPQETMV